MTTTIIAALVYIFAWFGFISFIQQVVAIIKGFKDDKMAKRMAQEEQKIEELVQRIEEVLHKNDRYNG